MIKYKKIYISCVKIEQEKSYTDFVLNMVIIFLSYIYKLHIWIDSELDQDRPTYDALQCIKLGKWPSLLLIYT